MNGRSSGLCNNCQGNGHMAGHGAAPNNPRLHEKCGTCGGTGKCRHCQGSGQHGGHPCPNCWRR